MRVAYINEGYPEKRCIISKGPEGCEYKRIAKLYGHVVKLKQALRRILCKVFSKQYTYDWDIRAIYKPHMKQATQMIHTFNTVCDTKIPWIATFETIIPRTNATCNEGLPNVNEVTRRGFELLSNDSCKALIALSEANRKIQIRAMEYLGIPNRHQIEQKILVCPPPQPVLITEHELSEKLRRLTKRIDFLFVGRLFFRKGGAQVVDAFVELAKQYPNIHLTVVSSLQYGDSVSRSTVGDKDKYLKLCMSTESITYYESLPNDEVLKLCKMAHCGLLPTYADTYGYSVLEMQSCGCPVITTDIRAMPEMNDNHCGWLINLPKHPSTEAIYGTIAELECLKEIVKREVKRIMSEIVKDPDEIGKRATLNIERIKVYHSPERYAQFLMHLYEN